MPIFAFSVCDETWRIFAAVNNWDSLNYFKHFIDILAYKVI